MSLEVVAARRWGSLDRFNQMLAAAREKAGIRYLHLERGGDYPHNVLYLRLILFAGVSLANTCK